MNEMTKIPPGFGLESEHPMLSMPFTVSIGGETFEGKRLSITEVEIATPDEKPTPGAKDLARITFPFEDFSITLTAQLSATDRGEDGASVLLFAEPTGDHLPQLRYLINAVIAGDVISLKGLMAYSGPTEPTKTQAKSAKPTRDRLRSLTVALISMLIAFLAGSVVFSRYTTAYELYPVFIEPAGLNMQATVAGQVTYLNAEAAPGEVAYTIAANTGDVLSFQMPQAGEVAVGAQIYEGATVLPTDLILTILEPNAPLRLTTLISIEGLTRALQGDIATLDMPDGRELRVRVVAGESTRTSALRGDLYVPVNLAVPMGSLGPSDTNASGRLRLSKSFFGSLGINEERR